MYANTGGSVSRRRSRIPRLYFSTLTLQPQRGGGVVGPGVVDADVAAEGGQGAVPGLVGDGAVAGAAEVGVGDEAGAQAVRAVRGGVQAGPGDGLLDQVVDRFGVQRPGQGPVALADRPEHRAILNAGGGQPGGEGGDRAAGGVVGPGEDDEFGLLAGLV